MWACNAFANLSQHWLFLQIPMQLLQVVGKRNITTRSMLLIHSQTFAKSKVYLRYVGVMRFIFHVLQLLQTRFTQQKLLD